MEEEELLPADASKPTAESPFDFEERFRRLLFDMGLSDVDGGRHLVIGGHQIDACGGIDGQLLLFDCTIRRGSRGTTKQIRSKIEQWRGKADAIRAALGGHPVYSKYTAATFVIAANAPISQTDQEYSKREKPEIAVLTKQHIDYLSDIADDIGPYARYRLASLLGIHIPRRGETVPALRIRDRGAELYLFATSAKSLAELAFVPQAEAGFEFFYQRLVNKAKIRAISDYVVNKKRPFPNSVVLASSTAPSFRAIEGFDASLTAGDLATGWLDLPTEYGSYWVVDGQHRIYGSALSKQPTCLAATLLQASDLEKAGYFLDINSDQTKINSDLKWDLRARLEANQPVGKISQAIQLLDELEGPLFGKVKVPHKGSTRGRSIKLSGLCDAVLRNRIHETHQYSWKADDFTKLLSHDLNVWLKQVDSEIPDGPVKRNFLFDNSGLSVQFIVFKRIAKRADHLRPSVSDLNRYAKAVATWFGSLEPHDAGRLAKLCSSEGGRSEVADMIVHSMNEQLPSDAVLELSGQVTRLSDEIKSFEAHLRTRIDEVCTKSFGSDWLESSGLGHSGREALTKDGLTLGQVRSLLSKDQYWRLVCGGFEANGVKHEFALNCFDYVAGYRNAVEHGRVADANKFDSTTAQMSLRALRKGLRLS